VCDAMASYMCIKYLCTLAVTHAMPSTWWTGRLDRTGRREDIRVGVRACVVPTCQSTDLTVPNANPMDSIAYLRGAMILKTCVILKTAIYVCTDHSYNGQPALPFLSVFRSRGKTRQSTKAEQSAQGTFIIMAANKLKLEVKVKVQVEQKSLFSRLTQPAPCLSSVMVCFGNVVRSDLRFCTLWRRTEGVEMSIALMISS
jgi:hypothetical protein